MLSFSVVLRCGDNPVQKSIGKGVTCVGFPLLMTCSDFLYSLQNEIALILLWDGDRCLVNIQITIYSLLLYDEFGKEY